MPVHVRVSAVLCSMLHVICSIVACVCIDVGLVTLAVRLTSLLNSPGVKVSWFFVTFAFGDLGSVSEET